MYAGVFCFYFDATTNAQISMPDHLEAMNNMPDTRGDILSICSSKCFFRWAYNSSMLKRKKKNEKLENKLTRSRKSKSHYHM